MPDIELALSLVKTRLNRLPTDTTLDEYLRSRIEAAVEQLTGEGIHLNDTTSDTVLLVDYTVFQYGARDQQNGEPAWLRARIKRRWLREKRKGADCV